MDWQRYSNPTPTALPMVEAVEQGKHFKTCQPVTFRYLRGVMKAPDFGGRFQQDIEPAGRYMVHNEEPGDLRPGWETDVVTFQCPLVISLNTKYPDEGVYGPHSWKAALHDHFNLSGRKLSAKLRSLGYDGIVTSDSPRSTREIVEL